MKTLVTGGSGYIGTHILKHLLEQCHEVTVVTRHPEKLSRGGYGDGLTIVEADLEDPSWYRSVLEGQDCCIYAALVWGDERREIEGYDASITARFFEAVGQAKVRRAIYLSSTAVHRGSVGRINESAVYSSQELYGATKAAGEMFFRAACARHAISSVVVRPGPVVGRPAFDDAAFRGPQQVHALVEEAFTSGLLTVGQRGCFQLCDVHVLAQLLAQLTRSESVDSTYFCVGVESLSWEGVAELIAVRTGGEIRLSLENEERRETPYFQTDRMQAFLGRETYSTQALIEHLDYLIDKEMNRNSGVVS
ncbi:NAD-dependent epimerase/dehydratase family protein [Rubritalea spongiae]|uniref:NAD-dependent epimerase/dehydratase family protein n=1 Tax=Rubritalea spongiae TaxID=430797 RepID=A0ABW5E1H0_9BACT